MKYKYTQEPKEDCRFYDKEKHNCKGLNALYCAIDEKPCSFYKPKDTNTEVKK